MPIPGNSEPGAFSGQQQVQQKQSVIIPIKKRRFPMIEEKPSIWDGEDSKNKQDSNIPDEGKLLIDARSTVSPADTSMISPLTVKNEATPMDPSRSIALEAKSSVSLCPLDDLGNKKEIQQSEKSSVSVIPVKVELSLGSKAPPLPASKHHNIEAVVSNSNKMDSSSLTLALHEQKLVTMGNVSSRVSSNRSNWDLNTTMDVWEGSTTSDAFTHGLSDVGGLGKSNSCHESSSTAAGIVGLLSNKGKRIADSHGSSFSDVSAKPSQLDKADDLLGLRLATPYVDTGKERSSLSDNLVSSSASPNLNVRQVELSTMNVNRTVKPEPVEDNSKHDCSVGSSSSSSMELLKFSSVKREIADNRNLETVVQSSVSLEKLVDCQSMKSEVVQERRQEASTSEAASVQQFVGRFMQQQESYASSSGLALPPMHQNPCPSRLPTCSELSTCEDFPNQSEQSFHCKDLCQNEVPDEPIASVVPKPLGRDIEQITEYKVGSLGVADMDKHELDGVDDHLLELSQNVVANDEEKINLSPGMFEEDAFGSDFECQQDCAGDTICGMEDEEYEDGEVREPMLLAAGEDSIVDGKKTNKEETVVSDSQTFQPNTSDFEGKDAVEKNQEVTNNNLNKDWVGIYREPDCEDNSTGKKLTDEGLGVLVHEKRSISVTLDKQFDVSGKDVLDCPGKEVQSDVQDSLREEVHIDALIDGSPGIGIEPGNEAIEKLFKEDSSVEDFTLSKVEESLEGPDAVKDSNNVGNKSRIINLSRAVVTSPCKTKSVPNRLLTSRSGKEGYSDLDGEMQHLGKRDEFYTGGSNKFVRDRAHDQSFRNSRPNFMRGKGRMSGRFGPMHREWNSDHNFSSETSYGPYDNRGFRRKHAPYYSDVDNECNGYGVRQDGNTFAGNRRKVMNDEFPSARRTFFRRPSSGDRDGPMGRGGQMRYRIPRNMSPRRRSNEAGPDRHDDKFMQLSDEVVDPDHDRPQDTYDEPNDQFVRGNRNFSNMQRKGNPRIHSKSPVRSRTRSPGPWSSPRSSPNGIAEFTQHRPPTLFRTGRMRSPDRSCFRVEMVPRRRGSPSFVARHNNEMREGGDPRREHIHPRPADSNRRSSPGRAFPRNTRRADALDSREVEDGDEYMNGPLPNKFHELRGDGSIDERRKFVDRRGPRSFRPNFSNDNENFQFHNDGPRPYRFIPNAEADFAERNDMREREFDGQIKHQPMIVSRRIRNNIEEQQDGNFRPVERVWHGDGFSDTRGKKRRF